MSSLLFVEHSQTLVSSSSDGLVRMWSPTGSLQGTAGTDTMDEVKSRSDGDITPNSRGSRRDSGRGSRDSVDDELSLSLHTQCNEKETEIGMETNLETKLVASLILPPIPGESRKATRKGSGSTR